MAMKITLREVGQMLEHIVKHMATKDDIEQLDRNIITLQTQVTSIERQLREAKTVIRLADLEEKVFGKVRV